MRQGFLLSPASLYLAGVLLKMIINGEDVDAVPLEPRWLKQPGYLDAMLECLRLKHKSKIRETKAHPHFYLEAGSKMNDTGFDDGLGFG